MEAIGNKDDPSDRVNVVMGMQAVFLPPA